jgi:hypothetical protein
VTAQATVSESTAEPAQASGTVQFSVNGQQVGGPVALANGFVTAKLGPVVAGSTVTATYSGDSLSNGSVSAATTTN